MSEETSPKRGRGRPRKTKIVTTASPQSDEAISASATAEPAANRENANDLEEPIAYDPNWNEGGEYRITATPSEELGAMMQEGYNEGFPQPNGDVSIALNIRETYVGALRDAAQQNHKTLRENMQEMLDWWLENEFSQVAR